MDRVLAPAAAVMRRLSSFTAKFSVISIVLLFPLVISLTGGYLSSTEQVRVTRAELDGLAYIDPVIRLSVQLSALHDAVIRGEDPRSVSLTAVEAVDEIDERLGGELGVHAEWHAVRERLARLSSTAQDPVLNPSGGGPVVVPSSAEARRLAEATEIRLVMGRVLDLAVTTGTSSHLLLDPDVNSHQVIATLISHLPSLLDATAQAREAELHWTETGSPTDTTTEATGTGTTATGAGTTATADAADAPVPTIAQHELVSSISRISSAMRQAWSSSADDRVRESTQPEWALLDGRARSLNENLTTHSARVDDVSVSFLDSVQPFAMSLSEATGMLLRGRVARLERSRLLPFVLSLTAVLLAGYFFMALFRQTSRDARTVLSEINSVAEGALHQGEPLPGRDEFAQMSRAAVIARDRLTSLLGQLRFQATHDDLTSLGNRTLLREKIAEVLADSAPGQELALAFVELEGFADVNDSFGHDIGDQVLRTVGARFHHAVRRRDVVVRLGGDDFAVLLPHVQGKDDVTEIVRRVQATLDEPIVVGGRRLRLRANAGIAMAVAGEVSAAELQRNADVAKYAARDLGTGEPAFFEQWLHDRTAERAELSADLAQAIAGGQLEVVYQPIIDLGSGVVHGAEALVRWNHPTRGAIKPDVFVPLAEATGAIGPLTSWVLREAAAQLQIWRRDFPDAYPMTMDVNISATQLSDDRILADLVSILEQTGVDPRNLVLEITESALMRDVDNALRRLRQIAAIGVNLALDDFGTGYSSLSHLRHLPISVLKIDKSFVTSGSDDPDPDDAGAAMLRGITGLGASLGMLIVAEGVETAEQESLLRDLGCHLGQGFRYASPLTAADFTRYLRASRPSGRWPVSDARGIPVQRADTSVTEPR